MTTFNPVAPSERPALFEFSGHVSEATLRAYLGRAVTYNNALSSASRADDLRIVKDLEVCFLGRSAYLWKLAPSDDSHFELARDFTSEVHRALPHVICQAAVFEAVYPGVDQIPIPGWVFEELGESVEARTFSYEAMFGPDFEQAYRWTRFGAGCQVPDFTLPETRRWFYYRARRYVDAGYEAIHLGQTHLYAQKDAGYALFSAFARRLRDYAKRRARRAVVLLDAHTHGISADGTLLFDFHSRPLSARNLRDSPDSLVLQHKGQSLGGKSPHGWTCEALPYLIEVDNWGGWSVAPKRWHDTQARRAQGRWGWDDISWLAHQDERDRNAFFNYAYPWLRLRDPAAYFQLPLRRLLADSTVLLKNAHGEHKNVKVYHANNASAACPAGFAQEEAIRSAWATPEPAWLAAWYGAAREGKERVAQPVTLVGSLQAALGGIPGESVCPYSTLRRVDDNLYGLATVIPHPGEYDFAVAVGGTMTEVYRQNGLRGNAPYKLSVPEPNLIIYLQFDALKREVTVFDSANRALPIT